MSLWESARDFVAGIIKRFYFWLPAVLLDPFDVYDRYLKPSVPNAYRFDFSPPVAVFLGALVGLLGLAAIFTYHDLNSRYAQAITKLVGLPKREREVIDRVGALRHEGVVRLLNRKVRSDADLDQWQADEVKWREEVLSVLREDFPAVVHRLSTLGTLSAASFTGAFNDTHNHALMMLAKRLSVLESLLDQYTGRR